MVPSSIPDEGTIAPPGFAAVQKLGPVKLVPHKAAYQPW